MSGADTRRCQHPRIYSQYDNCLTATGYCEGGRLYLIDEIQQTGGGERISTSGRSLPRVPNKISCNQPVVAASIYRSDRADHAMYGPVTFRHSQCISHRDKSVSRDILQFGIKPAAIPNESPFLSPDRFPQCRGPQVT